MIFTAQLLKCSPNSMLAVLVLVMATVMTSCTDSATSGAAGDSFTLDINLTGAEDGIAYLVRETAEKATEVDSVEITGGKCVFTGSVSSPEVFYIRINDFPSTVPVFVENRKISVAGPIDSIMGIEVEGSPSHKELMSYMETYLSYNLKDKELKDSYYELLKVEDTAGQYQEIQSIMMQVKENTRERELWELNYPLENAGTPAGAYLAWVNTRLGKYREETALFAVKDKLTELQPESPYTEWVSARTKVLESTRVGNVAPDFTMNDTQGNPVNLSDFRGKYLLLDFWAGWCRPCRAENPNLVNLYSKYNGAQFEILGVSLDSEKGYWEQAIAQDGLTWPQVSELKQWNSEVVGLYGVQSIPFSLILDPEGKIIAKNLRGPALEQKLAEIFGA